MKSNEESKSANNKGGKKDFNNPVYYDFTMTTSDMEQTDNIYEALAD